METEAEKRYLLSLDNTAGEEKQGLPQRSLIQEPQPSPPHETLNPGHWALETNEDWSKPALPMEEN